MQERLEQGKKSREERIAELAQLYPDGLMPRGEAVLLIAQRQDVSHHHVDALRRVMVAQCPEFNPTNGTLDLLFVVALEAGTEFQKRQGMIRASDPGKFDKTIQHLRDGGFIPELK